jgi:cysteine desulfurase family protein (TIGR01976 family)
VQPAGTTPEQPARAASLDLPRVRARFPALAGRDGFGRPVVHADAPGGTQAVDRAIDAMAEHLRAGTANQHGAFPLSGHTDQLVDDVRWAAARFLGTEADGIVFGPNMTSLTFHLANALDACVGAGDNVVCTQLDHDANVSPWLQLADRTGAEVRWITLDPATGRLRHRELERLVDDRTRVVAFPGASNALGTIVDPAPFVTAAKAVGALTFMDAVHLAPHQAIDRKAAGVDVVACSPYKFFGPHAGLLAASPELLRFLSPQKLRPAPDHGPERWQTGTASFEAIAGTGGAFAYLDEVGMDAIAAHEATLTRRFLAGVATIHHVTLHGPAEAEGRTPTFALTVDGWTSQAVAETLGAEGINVWAGHYYAVEPMRALGLLDHGGAVRVGFVHYHGADEVDRVLEALGELVL